MDGDFENSSRAGRLNSLLNASGVPFSPRKLQHTTKSEEVVVHRLQVWFY